MNSVGCNLGRRNPNLLLKPGRTNGGSTLRASRQATTWAGVKVRTSRVGIPAVGLEVLDDARAAIAGRRALRSRACIASRARSM